MKNKELGYQKGETCNRDGCIGIIDEHEKEGSCSCHINPPCSFCTTDVYYCPVCDWDANEEMKANNLSKPKEVYSIYHVKTFEELDKTKIDWVSEGHTHFTMRKRGVYPEGTTSNEVKEKVNGTFGGRFESFGYGCFVFIAYTD